MTSKRWYVWDGSKNSGPDNLPKEAILNIEFRDGFKVKDCKASRVFWKHSTDKNSILDVVAYQVSK